MSRSLCDELARIETRGLLRRLRPSAHCGGKFDDGDTTILNFSSNDYLDLARHPRVKAAAVGAIERLGSSATASRLMAGDLEIHERLEESLAGFLGCEAALLFGSGFLANLAVLTTLAGRHDAVFADRLNHASLVDGARLSGAKVFRFRHGDVGHLEELLDSHSGFRRRIVVTDSIFSMDGDAAPVERIGRIAKVSDCLFVVDEAHALGVLGDGGRGLCYGLADDVRPDVVVATFSKAFGGYGGFVALDATARELLVNRARSFIYSTAPPPACVAAAQAALEIVRENPGLGSELQGRAAHLREKLAAAGLDTGPSVSQIVPVIVGANEAALELSEVLRERGILAVAVRPPTVPAGTARLRLSVTLAHEISDLDAAADAIILAAGKIVADG